MKLKALVVLILFLTLISSCQKDNEIQVLNFSEFETYLLKDDNKTHVIHFWATWCVPCLKELPEFNKLHNGLNSRKVDLLLVSLDFPKYIESDLKPFILDNNIRAKVVVLDDPDQNRWINKIDSTWSGAIPATLIYNRSKRSFFEQSMTYDELLSNIHFKE